MRELEMPLRGLPVHKDVLNITNASVHHHSGDQVVPAQHPWRRGIEDYEVGFRAWSNNVDVFTAEREAAVAGGEEEGLFTAIGLFEGKASSCSTSSKLDASQPLEPEAGLAKLAAMTY